MNEATLRNMTTEELLYEASQSDDVLMGVLAERLSTEASKAVHYEQESKEEVDGLYEAIYDREQEIESLESELEEIKDSLKKLIS